MVYDDSETRKSILKGQSLNIAFAGFNAKTDKDIKQRIETAHDIYNECMKQGLLLW